MYKVLKIADHLTKVAFSDEDVAEGYSEVLIPRSVRSVRGPRNAVFTNVDFKVSSYTRGICKFLSKYCAECSYSFHEPVLFTRTGKVLYIESKGCRVVPPIPEEYRDCEQVSIMGKFKEIGPRAFQGMESLRSVDIFSPIGVINSCAFRGCSNLSCINLPISIFDIGHSAFYGCSNMMLYKMPECIRFIGHYAFYGCSYINEFIVPATIKRLGTYCFAECTRVRSVELPDGLYEIPAGCFSGCVNLRHITISPNLTKVGDEAFKSCKSLRRLPLKNNAILSVKDTCSGCPAFPKGE